MPEIGPNRLGAFQKRTPRARGNRKNKDPGKEAGFDKGLKLWRAWSLTRFYLVHSRLIFFSIVSGHPITPYLYSALVSLPISMSRSFPPIARGSRSFPKMSEETAVGLGSHLTYIWHAVLIRHGGNVQILKALLH